MLESFCGPNMVEHWSRGILQIGVFCVDTSFLDYGCIFTECEEFLFVIMLQTNMTF